MTHRADDPLDYTRSLLLVVSVLLLGSSRAAAEWEAELKLSVNETRAALNENMGHCLLAHGTTVHAVWTDFKGTDSAIHYRRSDDCGSTWTNDVRLSPTPGADSMPLLAQSGHTLHLVFLRHAGTPKATSYYKRSSDGGRTWQDEVSLGMTKWWPGVAAAGKIVYVSLNTVFADDPTNSVVHFRRSLDDGMTWEEPQQISLAPRRNRGRAEDPAISANGNYVHLVWNDNREALAGKGMAVYYRRSADHGKTWGKEIALSRAPEFTYFPALWLTGAHVDIVYGDRQSGHYDLFHLHSPDQGETWGPRQEITKTPSDEFYPAIVRDGTNVHLTWFSKEGIAYLRSRDGGKTWAPVVALTRQGTMPFIATAGDAVYLLFVSNRDGHPAIFFKRDLAGNKTP